MRSFENENEDKSEGWLQIDACELGFQHMAQTDIVNAVTQ
jgi:hypothetical protein